MTKHCGMQLTCPHCFKYTTNRNDNLLRHIRTEHSNFKMVRSLVDEVLSNVVVPSAEEFEEQGEVENETEEVSPYVRARDERVASIQVEFRRLYPSFGQEVGDLGLIKKKRKNPKKTSSVVAISRRSSRIVALGAVHGESFGEVPEGEEAGMTEVEEAVASGTEEIAVTRIDEVGGTETEEAFVSEDACDPVGNEAVVGEEEETGDAGDENSGDAEEGVAEEGVVEEGVAEEGVAEEGVVREDDFLVEIVSGGEGAGDVGVLGKFGCLPCSLKCRDRGTLMRHVKLVHEPRKVPVKCPRPWCQAQFYVLTKMWEHKISCLKVCPYCQKAFVRQDKFDSHQRYHLVLNRRMED